MKEVALSLALAIALPAVSQAVRDTKRMDRDLDPAREGDDVRSAFTLFNANLDAIRHRDRDAYLACYLRSPKLARSGPEGPALGFDDFAKQAGGGWPDTFDADDLRLVPVVPGVVYGTYRYRVRYGADEHSGLSERIFLKTEAGWRITMTSAFDAPPGTPPPPRALVGATLVDGTGVAPLRNAVVLLRAGKIECAGSRKDCPIPEGVTVTDATGAFVTPGLVDAHVHFGQTGWADGRPDALDVREKHPYDGVEAGLQSRPERFLRSYACAGVTAVFDVGGYPWSLSLPKRAGLEPAAPHVRAAGPLLSTIDFWLNLPAERQFIHLKDAEAARTGVRYLASIGSSAVKVWYIVTAEQAVEASAPAVRAAGEEARRLGLPLIVHATGLAEAKEALRAGAALLVHSVSDKPVDAEFLDLAKKANVVYCPTLTVFRGYLRMFESVTSRKAPAVDDPNGCVDAGTRAKLAETATVEPGNLAQKVAARAERTSKLEAVSAQNLAKVRDAGIRIAMGTDAGNPLTLHGPSVYAEMEAMQAAGMKPMEVLVASTRGGASAMGLEKEIGTIEKGKVADLLVLNADPTADIGNVRRVRAVVRGGVLRTIEELRAVVKAGDEKK